MRLFSFFEIAVPAIEWTEKNTENSTHLVICKLGLTTGTITTYQRARAHEQMSVHCCVEAPKFTFLMCTNISDFYPKKSFFHLYCYCAPKNSQSMEQTNRIFIADAFNGAIVFHTNNSTGHSINAEKALIVCTCAGAIWSKCGLLDRASKVPMILSSSVFISRSLFRKTVKLEA